MSTITAAATDSQLSSLTSTSSTTHSSLKSTALVQFSVAKMNKTETELLDAKEEEPRDVLIRLDSLLARGLHAESESGPNSVNSSTASTCSSTPSSILKTSKSTDNTCGGGDSSAKKKSIRFPDEELHEVIGFGGAEEDLDSSSDEEVVRPPTSKRFEVAEAEEMTVDEKNNMNLTRQNTTFNAHAQNLNGNKDNSVPLLRLGVDKKVTPMITVRPFGMRNNEVTTTSKAVNMVSPMINGELVSKDSEDSGRGEATRGTGQRPKQVLNSDGGTESSSEDSDNSNPRATSVLEREFMKAKQTAASARLSFLNSTIVFEAKGEPTTDIVSNWVKTQEDEDEIDEAIVENSRKATKNVKLTRKSPYVVGHYASTAILKGTPKPSVNVRKPPIGREKPKVPQKPNKLLVASSTSSSTASSEAVSPVAAPRRASFRTTPNEYANVMKPESEVTISDDSNIELASEAASSPHLHAECYSAEADVQNSVILAVSTSNNDSPITVNNNQTTVEVNSNVTTTSTEAVAMPIVQQNLAQKNKQALEAIRESLAKKILVQEELSNMEDDEVEKIITRPKLNKTSSNNPSFEANRASVAASLGGGFNRQDKVLRPSTKRPAPKPPTPTQEASKEAPEVKEDNSVKEEAVEAKPPAIKSALATRHSSVKSDSSPTNRDNVVKSVQFSPETMTMTVPASEPDLQPISYNRWISRDPHGSPAIMESSFTGQPIAVQPPRPQVNHLNKKPVLNQPQSEDEIRKWTEKSKKSRSKSLPRGGSEIDEIMGSSKTKARSRLFTALVAAPQPLPATATTPVHRQSRVELYENDRKMTKRQNKFASIKKLFKLGSNPNLSGSDSSSAHQRRNSTSSTTSDANRFLDKEHEREIVDRELHRLRPDIIHPIDLQSGGVEVVKITPKSSSQKLYEKNHRVAGVNKAGVTKSILVKSKVDQYLDSKDSGHETSSIHTEGSEEAGSSTTGNESGGNAGGISSSSSDTSSNQVSS
jgi:hypothetical protein